ncbi:hypothetical protein Gorai_005904 [Gossypium raimondii]|uniref:DUF4283 domain-containing protein n=1 Tax=Gossypium raimondii TaxID=29730 RepID=A0A7J8QEK7_GOSRA|nr:hypothetical protein [Gossypium raimondii]
MNMKNSLSGEKASESRLPDDWDMKKVWFKGVEGVAGDDMIVESDLRPKGETLDTLPVIIELVTCGDRQNHFMDIENGHFLAKFLCSEDFNKVISQGPQIIYGLSGFIYKMSILEAVGELVGKVAKLDLNTDSKTRGHFARMVVFMDLDRPLEMCFLLVMTTNSEKVQENGESKSSKSTNSGEGLTYGLWVVVERKS